MKCDPLVAEWLRRAKSNLVRAKAGKISEDVTFEDLCFDAQQCTEKALKALCLSHGIEIPRTHSVGQLLTLLTRHGFIIPDELNEVDALTEYAVTTRYPGDWDPVDEEEYLRAVELAEKVFLWVTNSLEPQEGDESELNRQ